MYWLSTNSSLSTGVLTGVESKNRQTGAAQLKTVEETELLYGSDATLPKMVTCLTALLLWLLLAQAVHMAQGTWHRGADEAYSWLNIPGSTSSPFKFRGTSRLHPSFSLL